MITKDRMIALTKSGLIPFLEGRSGEGKTTYVKDLAKYLGLESGLRIMNLSAVESTDFCGLPFINDKGQSCYAKPNFLDCDILFLDEVDRVRDSSVKSSLLSLLIDRSINGHALKETCMIFTAGNGQDVAGEEHDTVEFDTAFEKRIIRIPFAYTAEEKTTYLKSKYPDNAFVKFLEVKPELFKTHDSRRIEAFLKVDNSFCEMILGKETARIFRNFVESNLVTLADIKAGKFDINTLSAITKSSLIIDIVSNFYEIKNSEAVNINKFINALRAEEKSSYFTKLKKLCLENPEKFNKKATELNGHAMFKGQKEFLTELTK